MIVITEIMGHKISLLCSSFLSRVLFVFPLKRNSQDLLSVGLDDGGVIMSGGPHDGALFPVLVLNYHQVVKVPKGVTAVA